MCYIYVWCINFYWSPIALATRSLSLSYTYYTFLLLPNRLARTLRVHSIQIRATQCYVIHSFSQLVRHDDTTLIHTTESIYTAPTGPFLGEILVTDLPSVEAEDVETTRGQTGVLCETYHLQIARVSAMVTNYHVTCGAGRKTDISGKYLTLRAPLGIGPPWTLNIKWNMNVFVQSATLKIAFIHPNFPRRGRGLTR